MRRILVLCFLSLFVALSAGAETSSAPLKRILPYLVDYVALSPENKTHFQLVHRVSAKEPLSEPIRLWVEMEERTVDLPVSDDGQVDWTPIVDFIDADLMLHTNIPKGQGSVALDVKPILAATDEMAMSDMLLAISQANKSIRSNAGAFSFLAPKMKALAFVVAEGTTAKIVDDDGAQSVLEANDDGFFEVRPKKRPFKNAKAIVFSNPPVSIGFID